MPLSFKLILEFCCCVADGLIHEQFQPTDVAVILEMYAVCQEIHLDLCPPLSWLSFGFHQPASRILGHWLWLVRHSSVLRFALQYCLILASDKCTAVILVAWNRCQLAWLGSAWKIACYLLPAGSPYTCTVLIISSTRSSEGSTLLRSSRFISARSSSVPSSSC